MSFVTGGDNRKTAWGCEEVSKTGGEGRSQGMGAKDNNK